MNVNILDNIDASFLQGFQHAMHILQGAAMDLAYWLAVITVGFSVIMMLLRGEELKELLSKLVQCGLLFGIFFGLIQLCGTWLPEWINSFMQIGAQASGIGALDPSSIFDQGYYIASTIIQASVHMGIMHLPTALLAVISSIFIVIIYALIAADLAVVLIKSYATVCVGPLIFALGNSEITRSTVTNYLSKIIGISLNLLSMYIIIGVGKTVGYGWVIDFKESAASGAFNFSAVLIVLGGLVLFYLVVKNVPAFIASISGAGGFRNYGDAAIGAAASAAGLTGRIAAQAVGVPGSTANAAHYGMRGAAGLGSSALGAVSAGSNTSLGKAFGQSIKGNWQQTKAAFKSGEMLKGAKHASYIVGAGVAGGAVGAFSPATKAAVNRIKRGPHKVMSLPAKFKSSSSKPKLSSTPKAGK